MSSVEGIKLVDILPQTCCDTDIGYILSLNFRESRGFVQDNDTEVMSSIDASVLVFIILLLKTGTEAHTTSFPLYLSEYSRCGKIV